MKKKKPYKHIYKIFLLDDLFKVFTKEILHKTLLDMSSANADDEISKYIHQNICLGHINQEYFFFVFLESSYPQ